MGKEHSTQQRGQPTSFNVPINMYDCCTLTSWNFLTFCWYNNNELHSSLIYSIPFYFRQADKVSQKIHGFLCSADSKQRQFTVLIEITGRCVVNGPETIKCNPAQSQWVTFDAFQVWSNFTALHSSEAVNPNLDNMLLGSKSWVKVRSGLTQRLHVFQCWSL